MAYIESTYPIVLTSGGGTVNLSVSDPYSEYDITGTATLAASWNIQASGSPVTNTKFVFNYEAAITLGVNTLTVFGASLTAEQALKPCVIISKYDGSAWDTKIIPDFESSDIIETFHIKDDAVDKDKIAADVAGTALGQNADGSLEVKVDNSTIETNSDAIRVKAAGITESHLNSSVAGDGLTGGAGTALSVNVDGTGIEISGDTLRLKDDGVTNAKLANMADGTVKGNISGSTGNPSDISLSTLFNDNAWSTSGNSGTTAGTNFIGTTDAVDLVFKVNNLESGRIDLANSNTAFGRETLTSIVSAVYNVAFGRDVLKDTTTGDHNTGIGSNALTVNISGIGNTAVGSASMTNSDTGSYNTTVGYASLQNNTSGGYNTVIGGAAASTIETGTNNVCVGYDADVSSASATNRVAIGYQALADQDNMFALPNSITKFKWRGVTYTMPSANAAGVLTNDGSGNLSWA